MMKKVGYAFYVHKSNLSELFSNLDEKDRDYIVRVMDLARMVLLIDFDIVKFDNKTRNVSLIQCSTWDILNEPIVEDSYCFHPDFSYKIIKGGTKVYHHRWMFVSENYKGFDLEKSKQRTWMLWDIPEFQENKNRVGSLQYWEEFLKKYNLDK